MKQTFDTDMILFKLLNDSAVASIITGGIYKRKRPNNSVKEDIVVNTITLTQDYFPQIGTSNINIHVADIDVKIGGVAQKVPDESRMKTLSEAVLSVVRNAMIPGISATVEMQSTIQEAEINQHFVNIRISWTIHE